MTSPLGGCASSASSDALAPDNLVASALLCVAGMQAWTRTVVSLGLVVSALACGGGDAAPVEVAPTHEDGAPDAGASGSVDAEVPVVVDAGRRCSGKSAMARDFEVTVKTKGDDRTALVHVPATYDPTRPTAVVLNLHGLGNTPERQKEITGFDRLADERGFIAVYPRGKQIAGSPSCWNAGGCCSVCVTLRVDDTDFIKVLLDRITADACVDPKRVYAVGHSNGAMMTHALACRMSDRIAAIADVAGADVDAPCDPLRPVPHLHVHGTADGLVPFDGRGFPFGWPAVPTMIDAWSARDRCTGGPVETFRKGAAHCNTRACGDGAEVELCTVDGGGHSWPGGPAQSSDAIPVNQDLDASARMVDFLFRHPMP
jgi:polyhydroxybutyrate depolymerase